MPLPCPSGTISLLDIQNEFGGSNPISINEYYRNGAYVGSNNTNVPTGGQISFADFFCAVNEIVKYITTTSTNVNASSYFTNTEWTSSAPKRLVINAGVTLGATSTYNYALTIPSGFGGTFRLDNNGSIIGAGGGANGGTGGNAMFVGAAISINNIGSIYSGGGGGGQGGAGGTGGTGGAGYVFVPTSICGPGACVYACQNDNCTRIYGANNPCSVSICGGTSCNDDCGRFNQCDGGYEPSDGCGSPQYDYYTSGGPGGSGGARSSGGYGAGYNQFATSGSASNPGSPGSAGGENAGTGGTGGASGSGGSGGALGSSGSAGNNGSTGSSGSNGNAGSGSAGSGGESGLSGGLAGYYIVNNSNVTWIATGTRAGRVG
jgi:hypothetical protein